MPLCVDLFSGAGGMSAGFSRAGWDVVAVERDAAACAVHAKNLPSSRVYKHTITEEAPLPPDLLQSLPPVGALVGGPPCVGFSRTGSQRGDADPRNGIPAFLRAVTMLSPSCVAMENVETLLRRHKPTLDAAVHRLQAEGYGVAYRVLDASAYGVPQRRRRLVLLAGKGWLPTFPPALETPPPTVGEALAQLHSFTTRVESLQLTARQEQYVAAYERRSSCANPRDLIPGKVARTLTCQNLGNATSDMARLRLEDGSRRQLTVAEAGALQGFPPVFDFGPSRRAAMRMIGNALPPPLAFHIASHLLAEASPWVEEPR